MTPDSRFPVLFAFVVTAASAQWVDFREPGVPRTADGKANLSAPAPKALDGKPDLSGVWMHETTTAEEMKRLYGARIDESIKVDAPGMEIGTQHRYSSNILLDFKPEELLRPEAVERMRRDRGLNSLSDACTPGRSMGFPLAGLVSEPIKIVQAPRLTVVFYEAGNFSRQIHTDGRVLPKEFDLPAFNGYSAGHWDGDTLVVETAGFNDKTWLDGMRHPHSEALHVTERFQRRDFGHLEYEIRFDDPKMYTRPFSVKIPHELQPDTDIFENYCENEKDSAHLPKR
ncbi:MAG TPA: hypothetical protein VKT49_06555 [Bryobacteraceae bacterium]|nr:hypothetical protein [Bryobacteraceae bacterium]